MATQEITVQLDADDDSIVDQLNDVINGQEEYLILNGKDADGNEVHVTFLAPEGSLEGDDE